MLRLQSYCNLLFAAEDEEGQLFYTVLCTQMFKITMLLNLADEAGRTNLSKLLCKILTTRTMSDEMISLVMDVMRKLFDDEIGFAREIGDVVENVMNNRGDLEGVINKIENLQLDNDDDIAMDHAERLLPIVASALSRMTGTSIPKGSFEIFVASTVIPALTSDNSVLQLAAIPCLVQYCLSDKVISIFCSRSNSERLWLRITLSSSLICWARRVCLKFAS